MFKLVISDTVQFPVKLSINDGGIIKDFSFRFEGRRLDMDRLQKELTENGDMKVVDYHTKICRENLTGWAEQRLVMGADGNPAPYTPEALDLVFSVPGAVAVIHGAYMDAIATSSGRAGRAKN